MHEIQQLKILNSRHLAYIATIFILQKNSENAEKYFRLAIKSTNNNIDGNYVELYSNIYLKIIETQKIDHELVTKLEQMKALKSTKRLLPIPVS